MLFKKRWPNLLLLILVGIEIYYFSSISSAESSGISTINLTKLYHVIVFFLFNFFLFSFIFYKKEIKLKVAIITILVSTIYAISDEIHQIFVPGRYYGIEDILTDTVGIFFSSIIFIITKTKKTKSKLI